MPKDPMNKRIETIFRDLMQTPWAIPVLVGVATLLIIALVLVAK